MTHSADAADRLFDIAGQLDLDGKLISAEPYGNGHINDTLLGVWDTPTGRRRCIHQRLNANVFPDLQAVMDNVRLVCDHLERAGVPSGSRLELIMARDGSSHVVDADGKWWRTYPFVEGTVTREQVSGPDDAAAAGLAFGRFLQALDDLPGSEVREVIPGFHDTPERIAKLDAARAADVVGRAEKSAGLLAFVEERREGAGIIVRGLASGQLPLRITHNDTKLNNVLLDAKTGEGRCVIDLDTLMPGSPLFDLGDLLRTSCSTGAEDEPEPRLIDCDLKVLESAVGAFAAALGQGLTANERELLPIAGPLITFECGVRFLTDHLDGDQYFKIGHPGHNLQRARAQFALVEAFERHQTEIEDICANLT